MSNTADIKFPVGRLVRGSLYDPQTEDAEGNPLVIKTGANRGQSRVDYWFAVAVPKTGETHWATTEWGKLIWAVGHTVFPAQAQSPVFAWKIIDGDSTITDNKGKGKKPCERAGYPGCWIVNFSSGFAPTIVNRDGSAYLLDPGMVQPGDWVEVIGHVKSNGSEQQPGIFINHRCVAFSYHGERINLGIDPKTLGLGQHTMPAGASLTPLSSSAMIAPATAPAPGVTTPPPAAAVPPPQAVVPHTAILSAPPPPGALAAAPPPAPAAPVRVMLPAAEGFTYEQLIANGWTDELLIQHGKMAP